MPFLGDASYVAPADTEYMSSAHDVAPARAASWRVTRDGDVVALVSMTHEAGGIVVSAGPTPAEAKPYRFDTVGEADSFVADIVASFSYLGCVVTEE
jgi:hypothetical protein